LWRRAEAGISINIPTFHLRLVKKGIIYNWWLRTEWFIFLFDFLSYVFLTRIHYFHFAFLFFLLCFLNYKWDKFIWRYINRIRSEYHAPWVDQSLY
jgi:hypothetical protein